MPFYDAAIIGAGFSGTMVAINLARQSRVKLRIALIERAGAPGSGVAYGTTDTHHLLNVRAKQMGAFADDPAHFYTWLQAHPEALENAGVADLYPDSFIPRLIYGEYLRDILAQTINVFDGIDLLHRTVTDIAPTPDGYALSDGAECVASARAVVLALGNFPPGDSTAGPAANPYAPEIYARLSAPGDVFLIGTGLTTLDLLATMARAKTEGTIHLLSRGGLLPQVHDQVQPYPAFLSADRLPNTALALLSTVRREIRAAATRGIGWQSVIDALRPLNQKLWQALPPGEQRKFLKRIRAFWDTHRHRCAPEIMAAYDKFAAEGRLIEHRGAFISRMDTPASVAVTWQPYGGGAPQTTNVHVAVSCTGPQTDCRKLDDPLVVNLLKRDLMAPDRLHIGADTADDGNLKNSTGNNVPRLYTIGTWRKGKLYESVAVPELREQAAALAATIIESVSASAGSRS